MGLRERKICYLPSDVVQRVEWRTAELIQVWNDFKFNEKLMKNSVAIFVNFFCFFQVAAATNNSAMNLIKSSLSPLFCVPIMFTRALHNHLTVAEGNEEHLTNSAEMSTTIIVAQLVAHGLGIKNNNLFFSLLPFVNFLRRLGRMKKSN